MDEWKVYKRCDSFRVKTPKCVNDLIEVGSISDTGIFGLGNIYSKSFQIADINYDILSDNEKIAKLEKWCQNLNAQRVPYKITINNRVRNMQEYRDNLLFEKKGDATDQLCDDLNQEILCRICGEQNGIKQEMYLTVRKEADTYQAAEAYFNAIDIEKGYQSIGSDLVPLDATQRLQILHDAYNSADENYITFDFKSAIENHVDFLDYIVPGKMDFTHDDYFIFKNHGKEKYGSCLYVRFPRTEQTRLSDRFLSKVMDLNIPMIASLDVMPIPQSATKRLLEKKDSKIARLVRHQNNSRVDKMDFHSELSTTIQIDKKNLKRQLNDFEENEQHQYYVMCNFVVFADNLEELRNRCSKVINTATGVGMDIDYSYMKQREAFNTILPIGVKNVANGRNMQTKAVASFFPFKMQEIFQPGELFLGHNDKTKSIIRVDRRLLINPHGWLLGVTGAGKTAAASVMMLENYLGSDADIIVVSPKNDYEEFARRTGGRFYDISPQADVHFNPFAYFDNGKRLEVIGEKTDFAFSLIETAKQDELTHDETTAIDQAVQTAYTSISGTICLHDIYNCLAFQNTKAAEDVRRYLRIFVEGSLNIFAEKEQIDNSGRVTVYGLKNIGSKLRNLAMLVMIESIKEQVFYNYSIGRATYLYLDELPQILITPQQVEFINSIWMLFRSMGCIITGMAQTITQLLDNYRTRELLENSEFMMIMKQKDAARNQLAENLGLSQSELSYIFEKSEPGKGILKVGTATVPFDLSLKKNTELYSMINTDFHEIHKR